MATILTKHRWNLLRKEPDNVTEITVKNIGGNMCSLKAPGKEQWGQKKSIYNKVGTPSKNPAKNSRNGAPSPLYYTLFKYVAGSMCFLSCIDSIYPRELGIKDTPQNLPYLFCLKRFM
jgi:hypothetical protein